MHDRSERPVRALAVRLAERGTTVAAVQPAWAAQLGDVPAAPERRQEWVRLAAEVDVFRDRFKIPAEQETAIPAPYRENPVGAELAARVTALHKSDALSNQPVAPEADRQRAAQEATAAALRARQATMAPPVTPPVKTPQAAPKAATSDPIVEAMRRKAERDRKELRKAGLGGRVSSAEEMKKAAEKRAKENRDRDRGGSER